MRAILGILYMEGEQAKKLGLPPGVLVLEAPPGSPAYEVRDRLFQGYGRVREFQGLKVGCVG